MVFSSYVFIFLFLPIVLIIYFWLSKTKSIHYQHIFLIAASLFFYAYFNYMYVFIIISSIVVNYSIALLMRNTSRKADNKDKHRKLFLVLGILFNIGLLGYFKYYDFFIENINAVFGASYNLKHIILPLGISFFTFQQLSFIISVYKKEERVENFIDYCVFVLFFPQLVAGPIVLYKEMIPQFLDRQRRYINYDNLSRGIFIFVIGLFKKACIADTISLFVEHGFESTNLSMASAWATSLFYTLQIYFDFSGYSDMAIGLGKMFNINIPMNFNSPYKSHSITEFWQRWHITLGRALRTYIYIPLGGNRKGKTRTYINLFLTFLVSGFWHGAAWTFIVWGVLHGIFVIIERAAKKYIERIPGVVRILITFLVVNFLWVLFRAETFSDAMMIYRGMFDFAHIGIDTLSKLVMDDLVNFPTIIDIAYVFGLIGTLLYVVFRCKNSVEMTNSFTLTKRNLGYTALLFCASVIHLTRESVFIYFNF